MEAGAFSAADQRGRHVPHNKTIEDVLNDVRALINSFPRMEAHYMRSDTDSVCEQD